MSFERQFLLAAHALALLGVAALETTHEVGLAYVLMAAGAIVWSAWQGTAHPQLQLSAQATNLTMLIALVFAIGPVWLRGASPVRAIAEFLLVLVALKSLTVKTNRDWSQIFVLSFFQLVAAAALTVEPIFAVLFLTYLLLAPCALVLFHLRREIAGAGAGWRLADEAFVEPSLFRGIAGVTGVLFVSTLIVFAVFPRMGAGYFAPALGGGVSVTGFSEAVGLGAVAALKRDDAVALRVTVDDPDVLAESQRYWRGAALDRFDGRRWLRSPQEARLAMRPEPNVFVLGAAGRRAAIVAEDILLEPHDSPALFVAGQPIEIRGRFSQVDTDPLGNVRVMSAAGVRLRYQVTASFAPRTAPPTAETREASAIDPRIVTLASSEVDGLKTDELKAGALLTLLRRGFRYSLEPGDPGAEDPLVRFLFETKSGHCEYFASAYAVMLRAVGIPSLVVNGYAGGEWNPYGRYFVIRQSDAHSWVEAYVGGAWRTFDPTPPSGQPSGRPPGGLAALLDAYRMRWYRYVVNYSLEDQAEMALSVRDRSRDLWDSVSLERWDWRTRSRDLGRTGGSVAAAAAVFGLGYVGWRRRGAAVRKNGERAAWPTRRYAALLRLLERHGMKKRPGETPDEFWRRIGPNLDPRWQPAARVTELYQEARFSGRSGDDTAVRAEIDALLSDLRRL